MIRKHQPDAVCAFPATFYSRLCRLGLSIPKDLGFAAFPIYHDQAVPDGDLQFFAGVNASTCHQGAMAMEHLHALISAGNKGTRITPAQFLITPSWLDGQTLPRLHHPS